MNNHIRAKKNFEQNYAKNIVRWSGALKQKSRSIDAVVGVVLDIKMNPTDSNPDYFDIQLLLTRQAEAKYRTLIEKIQQGDIIEFRGILKVMGDEYHFNVMEALELKETGQRIDLSDIPQISYTGSSYSLRKPKPEQSSQPISALPSSTPSVDTSEKPKEQVKTEEKKLQDKKETATDDKKKSSANDQAAPVKDEAVPTNNQTNTTKGNEQTTPTSDQKTTNGTQTVTQDQGNDQAAAVSDDKNNKGVPEPGVPEPGAEGKNATQSEGQVDPAKEPKDETQNDAATSTMVDDVKEKDGEEPPKQKS